MPLTDLMVVLDNMVIELTTARCSPPDSTSTANRGGDAVANENKLQATAVKVTDQIELAKQGCQHERFQ